MDTMKLFEKTVKEQEIYSGRIIRVHLDDVVLENGSETKREVVDHPGGVSEAGELLAAPTRTSLEESLTARTFRPMPPVMVATLGSNAGIAGAADLAGTD